MVKQAVSDPTAQTIKPEVDPRLVAGWCVGSAPPTPLRRIDLKASLRSGSKAVLYSRLHSGPLEGLLEMFSQALVRFLTGFPRGVLIEHLLRRVKLMVIVLLGGLNM